MYLCQNKAPKGFLYGNWLRVPAALYRVLDLTKIRNLADRVT